MHIPDSVVEAAWADGDVRRGIAAALAEYERLGWALVPAEAYDPVRDPRPGRSFWRDETDEPHPDDVPRPVRDDEATVEAMAALLKERHEFPEFPYPPDGEMATEETWAEQEAWGKRWDELDDRIRAALTAAQGGE